MKVKVFWLVVNLLMVTLLILVSCGPKAAPTPTPVTPTPTPAAPVPTPAPALPPTPTPATTAEQPKYGGTINVVVPFIEENFAPTQQMWGEGYILEQLLSADYTRSMAGTGEFDLGPSTSKSVSVPSWEYMTGWIAESFKIAEHGVWVLNIRKGVHFALDPASEASRLVNGREMTLDDVKSSLEFFRDTPGSRPSVSRPGLFKNMTVEKTGPWQLTVRTPVDTGGAYVWVMGGGGAQYVWPKEWLGKYGKTTEWRDMVGTGPYMFTDLVSGSALTLKRNPNYWRKDPRSPGKGNQLPYPDVVKILIIPDLSTRLATMRTGRGDVVEDIQLEDAQSLIRTLPTLKSYRYVPRPIIIAMRTDKEEMPYSKVKARQALTMAIDFEAIKRDLYGGQAEIFTLPVSSALKHIYWPIEELPQSVQALYKYNPEGAKQLLAEAGYPNGFKAKMIVRSVTAELDLAAVVKAMWVKAGVDLEIQPKETAVHTSIRSARSHEELYMFQAAPLTDLSQRYSFALYLSQTYNVSYVNEPPGKDPTTEQMIQTAIANSMVNPAKADQAIHDWIPYVLGQAYYISLPAPFTYRIWQPWLKGYLGEGGLDGPESFAPYPWVDQDLKEQMTGRK